MCISFLPNTTATTIRFLCLSFRHKYIEREEQEKMKPAVTLWEAGNVTDEEKGIYQSLAKKNLQTDRGKI